MDPKFLKKVQECGWHLEQVSETQVVGRCPAEGCGMKALLKQGEPVPQVDPDQRRNGLDVPVESFDHFRRILRERREDLGLRIWETEYMVGVAIDFFAKVEKENPSKTVNFQTALDWAQALGFEIVLRPTSIDNAQSLSIICETRDKLPYRRRRNNLERERRGAGTRPRDLFDDR